MKNLIALTLLLFSPAFAFAQDAESKEAPKPVKQEEAKDKEAEAQEAVEVPEGSILPPGVGPQPKDSAAEIIELFKRVDEKMKAIDAILFDMGAGELPLAAPEDSGLGDLLSLTKGASDDVVRDIDRILKIADEMSKSQRKSGQSGSDKQGQKGQTGQTKEGEGEKQQGDNDEKEENDSPKKQGEQGEDKSKPEDEEGEQKEGEPKSGKESDETGQNSPNGGTSAAKLGAGSQANRSERWGELPERLRETFRTQGGEDLPLFYRDWIESYYRHLIKGDSR
jgi:cobalamin biosynthesis protein CobT